jgi:hypothetical protein
MRIFPDARAWVMLTLTVSPVLALWTVVWLRRPTSGASAIPVVGGLLVLVFVSLIARTVSIDETGITQGWRPFATRIAYADIDHIHHVSISSRYGSSPCLAITPRGGRTAIRLPMKSFNLQKRRRLVKLLTERAPGARIDRTVLSTLAMQESDRDLTHR